MDTILVIAITAVASITLDFTLGYVVKRKREKKLKREETLFLNKMASIFEEKDRPIQDRIDDVKELCRMTDGKMATGVYFGLDTESYE